jgi:hypothetical protein
MGGIYFTNERNTKCMQDFGYKMEEEFFIHIRITASEKNVFEDSDQDYGYIRVKCAPVQQQ